MAPLGREILVGLPLESRSIKVVLPRASVWDAICPKALSVKVVRFPLPSVKEDVASWLWTTGAGLVGVPWPPETSASPWSLLELKDLVSPPGLVDWLNLPAKS